MQVSSGLFELWVPNCRKEYWESHKKKLIAQVQKVPRTSLYKMQRMMQELITPISPCARECGNIVDAVLDALEIDYAVELQVAKRVINFDLTQIVQGDATLN